MNRLLGWLEFRAWMEKIAVTICQRCDCSLLNTIDEDEPRPTVPILDPSRWPPELEHHQ